MIPSLRPVDARHLAIVRIAVFGTWLVILASTRLDLLAGLPRELVRPTGVALLLPIDLLVGSPTLLTTIQILAILGCVACVLGVRPFTPIAVGTAILLFVCDGLMKSIGMFDNHTQWGPLLAALLLALSPAADAWSLPHRGHPDGSTRVYASHDRYAAPMVAMAAVVSLAYVMIGARRIVDGALTVLTDDSMLVWSVVRSLEDHSYPWDGSLVLLGNEWLLPGVAIGFVLVTAFEILTPLALRYAAFRTAWLCVMVPFHLSTLVVMRIFFWENLILLAVLLTGMPALIIRLTERKAGAPLIGESTSPRGPCRGSLRPQGLGATRAPSAAPATRTSPPSRFRAP